jgi:hypothetical protein
MQTQKSIILLVSAIIFLSVACNMTSQAPTAALTATSQPVTAQPIIETSTIAATALPTATSTNQPADSSIENTPAACSANWFFNFDESQLPLSAYCPEPVKNLEAVGQDFEGGRVYRYAPDPAYTADQRGTVFVIYNDGEWVTFPDTWDTTQPASDPNLIVPAGWYQPVDSIGKVWRDNPEVRNRLGWAYEPQSRFAGRIQSYLVQSGLPSGDTHFFFIDHGKWGTVLLLNSVDMGPNKWEVAGTYP